MIIFCKLPYLIGNTGSGKITILENLIFLDGLSGKCLIYFDPHSDSSQKLYSIFKKRKISNVTYFDVADSPQGIGCNQICPLAVSGIIEVFKKIWDDSWGSKNGIVGPIVKTKIDII